MREIRELHGDTLDFINHWIAEERVYGSQADKCGYVDGGCILFELWNIDFCTCNNREQCLNVLSAAVTGEAMWARVVGTAGRSRH